MATFIIRPHLLCNRTVLWMVRNPWDYCVLGLSKSLVLSAPYSDIVLQYFKGFVVLHVHTIPAHNCTVMYNMYMQVRFGQRLY